MLMFGLGLGFEMAPHKVKVSVDLVTLTPLNLNRNFISDRILEIETLVHKNLMLFESQPDVQK